jgi:hypothetical protein
MSQGTDADIWSWRSVSRVDLVGVEVEDEFGWVDCIEKCYHMAHSWKAGDSSQRHEQRTVHWKFQEEEVDEMKHHSVQDWAGADALGMDT